MFFGGRCPAESAAAQVVQLFVVVMTMAIFIRALLSWFNMDPRSPVIQTLNQITEPIIEPIRRIMPRIGMFDLSPIVAMIVLQVIGCVLQSFLDDNLA